MKVRFSVLEPDTKRGSYEVPLPIIIGRGSEAKFRIQQDRISRKHCEVFERNGEVFVRDLGSTNGTFLDGGQIAASVKTSLPPGSVLRIGTIAVQVDYESADPATLVGVGEVMAEPIIGPEGLAEPLPQELEPAEPLDATAFATTQKAPKPIPEPILEVTPEPSLDPIVGESTEPPADGFADLAVAEEHVSDPFAAGLFQEGEAESPEPQSFDFLSKEPAADTNDEGLDDFFKGLK